MPIQSNCLSFLPILSFLRWSFRQIGVATKAMPQNGRFIQNSHGQLEGF
jgi:hypothetical protein